MKPSLTKSAARDRLEKLRGLIDHYRYQTHVLNKQEISEAALDSLKHELAQLESQYPDLITPDSPSQRVAGKPLPQFKKVTHSARMFSLEDVFSAAELEEWDARWRKIARQVETDYVVDLKLDGLAISLQYDQGLFTLAATRGDGFIGEDVTHIVKTIDSVPLRLRTDDLPPTIRKAVEGGIVEIRGEAVMLKKDFETLNKHQAAIGAPLFANPRNVSAGTIRQLDPAVAAKRRLTFYAWELVTDLGQETIAEAYNWLKTMGIKTNPRVVTCPKLSDVEAVHQHVEQERGKLPFWIDGMVVKINQLDLYRRLGFIGKTPRSAVAWKYSAEQASTVIEDIVVQVGRTGAMTPVAHLRPVQLAGTTVARATLHNADEISRLDVRIGDTVIAQKAGDIIPEIVSVLKNLRPTGAKPWRMVRQCPICHQEIQRRQSEVIHYCVNVNCPAKKREGLYHFVSRPAFDIVGLGPSTIDVLVEENLVHDPADLFKLKEQDLIGLPLFAEKKSANLITSIHHHQQITLDRFIYALGIRHVGQETARTLAQTFRTIDNLLDTPVEKLMTAPDVGGVVGRSIAEFFQHQASRRLVGKLRTHINITSVEKTKGGPLQGQSIVVTGSLSTMTREEAEEHIRRAGGKAVASVSAKTSAVVIGADPGSKADRAKTLGVPVWSEEKFRQQLGL